MSVDARATVLVDTPSSLDNQLAGWAPQVVGLDVERADGDRYHRRAALLQLGDADRCLLVDAIALDDLTGVHDFLAGRLVVLHAAQNDVVPLASAGVRPPRIADTALAAQLLGLPAGLDPLLQELLGISLSPDKERFQRADWERRPLPPDMLDYAAGDVFDLPRLWDDLAGRLDEAGRTSWYQQELEHLLSHAMRDERSWERVKGAGRLEPGQRAVLKALWDEREQIADSHDIAPNLLLRDAVLVDLAKDPAGSPRELAARQQRRKSPVHEHRDALFAAQQVGRESEPPQRRGGRRPSPESRRAFDAMRKVRSRIAKDLGIDPGVLLSSRALTPAAHGDPSSPDELHELADLRPWHVDLLGDALWEAYTSATS